MYGISEKHWLREKFKVCSESLFRIWYTCVEGKKTEMIIQLQQDRKMRSSLKYVISSDYDARRALSSHAQNKILEDLLENFDSSSCSINRTFRIVWSQILSTSTRHLPKTCLAYSNQFRFNERDQLCKRRPASLYKNPKTAVVRCEGQRCRP